MNYFLPNTSICELLYVSFQLDSFYCRLFFLAPATEETKTQAENSSQKLKEKTQPQGGTVLFLKETQEKNSILPKKF